MSRVSLRSPGLRVPVSVIVSRHAKCAGNVLIARGELHAGAGRVLADGVAIKLLPRRLVRRMLEAAIGLELGVALLHLVVRDENVGAALVQIDAHLVAVPEDREPAIGGGFRRSIEGPRGAPGAQPAGARDAVHGEGA